MKICKAWYINLDICEDRKLHIEENVIPNLSLLTQDIERFSAIDMSSHKSKAKRSLGCTKSHLRIWEEAEKKNYKYIMVFEDDLCLNIQKEELQKRIENLFKLFPDFNVCNLAYNNTGRPLNKAGEGVFYAKSLQTTCWYIMNVKFIPVIKELVKQSIMKLEQGLDPNSWAIDQVWKKLQNKENKWFALPRCGKQKAGYSFIEGFKVDYGV